MIVASGFSRKSGLIVASGFSRKSGAQLPPVVEKLTNEDIVNILAYPASRKP